MTPERWQDVRRVLNAALELEPDQRPTYLDGACANDPSMRREVEGLLASADDIRSSFLQSPPGVGSAVCEGSADEHLRAAVHVRPVLSLSPWWATRSRTTAFSRGSAAAGWAWSTRPRTPSSLALLP